MNQIVVEEVQSHQVKMTKKEGHLNQKFNQGKEGTKNQQEIKDKIMSN